MSTQAFPTNLMVRKTPVSKIPWYRQHPQNIAPEGVDISLSPIAFENFTYKPMELQNVKTIFKNKKVVDKWLAGPDMSFYNQQLNFAVYCATTGCGVGLDLLQTNRSTFPESKIVNGVASAELPSQAYTNYITSMNFIGSLLQFHVYFTTRRILDELKVSLPTEASFNPVNNSYDKTAYDSLLREFNIPRDIDFRNKGYGLDRTNYGTDYKTNIGTMYDMNGKRINGYYNVKAQPLLDQWSTPEAKSVNYWNKFNPDTKSKEVRKKIWLGTMSHNFYYNRWIKYIIQDKKYQYKEYMMKSMMGLTGPGSVRINKSLEVFVYSILQAQVAVKHSIGGILGLAAVPEFIDIVEDMIVTDKNMIEKFENVLVKTRRKLNFAISPNLRLIPQNLVVRVEDYSIPGFNNLIKSGSSSGVHFGINDDLNNVPLNKESVVKKEVTSVKIVKKVSPPMNIKPIDIDPILPKNKIIDKKIDNIIEKDDNKNYEKIGLAVTAAGILGAAFLSYKIIKS